MAKKQSRRTVSLNRRVYEAGAAYAASNGTPLSRIVEDLLLGAIGDVQLTSEATAQRMAPYAACGKRGRPAGITGTCSACGESGHRADADGLCSRTHLAAVDVLEHGESVREASLAHGVASAGVYRRLASLRMESP